MGQFTLRAIQAAVFIAVLALCIYASQTSADFPANGYVFVLFAAFSAFAITLIPYALFLAGKGLVNEIKRFAAWMHSGGKPSQPTRIDPVFTKAVDNSVTYGRISGDSSPRV